LKLWLNNEKYTDIQRNIAKAKWNKNNDIKWDSLSNKERRDLVKDKYEFWKKETEKPLILSKKN
jgi:hypothetical protein